MLRTPVARELYIGRGEVGGGGEGAQGEVGGGGGGGRRGGGICGNTLYTILLDTAMRCHVSCPSCPYQAKS